MPMNPTHIQHSTEAPETHGETLAVKGRRIMTNATKLFGVRTASGCGATRRDTRKWGLALFVAALVALLTFGWGASAAQAQTTPGVTQVTATGTIPLGDSLTGKVTFINTTQGYFRIEGAPGSDTGGVMVRLNDPGAVHSIQSGLGCSPLGGTNCSPDDRFILDPLNYTNVFATGF